MVALIVTLAIVAIIAIWAVSTNNSLVAAKNRCDNAEQQIATQLQRRFDLIPNLVATVKGYAKHESETLAAITSARTSGKTALESGDTAGAVRADQEITSRLVPAFNAVAEAYPDLKADKNFLALQEELTTTENKVAFARQAFNDAVLAYDNKVESFPSSIVASCRHFGTREGFAVEDEAAKVAPKVEF